MAGPERKKSACGICQGWACWYSGSVLDLYLEGLWLESWPGHWLLLLRFLWFSSVPLGEMDGVIPSLGLDYFFETSLQFIVHQLYHHLALYGHRYLQCHKLTPYPTRKNLGPLARGRFQLQNKSYMMWEGFKFHLWSTEMRFFFTSYISTSYLILYLSILLH
jgi:hypothetical protein